MADSLQSRPSAHYRSVTVHTGIKAGELLHSAVIYARDASGIERVVANIPVRTDFGGCDDLLEHLNTLEERIQRLVNVNG